MGRKLATLLRDPLEIGIDAEGEGTSPEPQLWRKSFAIAGKATEPTDDELAAINQFALEPVSKADVYVVPMRLCNDQLDRSDERFPVSYLNRFAETLPGKSLMRGHDYWSEPVGRFFDAEVRPSQDAAGNYVFAKAYMDANGPSTQSVRLGISKGVSIGFQPDKRFCDLCGKDYDAWYYARDGDEQPCNHIKGRLYNGVKCTLTYGGDTQKVEALEGSLVWLGCQYGAETSRNSAPGHYARKEHYVKALADDAGGKGDPMDEKEKAAAQATERELRAEIDRLSPLAEDGQKYREWQKAEIARLYTSMGEEAAGAALVKALENSDAASLDAVRKEADKRHAIAFAPAGAQVRTHDPEKDGGGFGTRRSVDEILFGLPRMGGAS